MRWWKCIALTVLLTSATPISSRGQATGGGAQAFDFMIGWWDIEYRAYDVETGEVTSILDAVQHAEYRNEGSLIVDEWTSYDPETRDQVSYGVTLRSYSPATGRWQHTYLRSGQQTAASAFSGQWSNGEMRASGSTIIPDGRVLHFRLRFYDITENDFKWMEEWSIDDGRTWALAKTQVAIRRAHQGVPSGAGR